MVTCKISELALPQVRYIEIEGNLAKVIHEELKWTDYAMQMLSKDKFKIGDNLSWAAFHTSVQANPVDPITLISLLLLLPEKAAIIAFTTLA